MFVLEKDDDSKIVIVLASWWEHPHITYESLASSRSSGFGI